MKKLLVQMDTDSHASVFDTVVAYDGGADHVLQYSSVTPENVRPLIEGSIFTRAPRDKRNTAIFVGGSELDKGQALLDAVTAGYFADFRVSVMLDSNGCNTTAAAGVARLAGSGSIKGEKTVVLAGTGPVGQRAAVMLAQEGAGEVLLTSRRYGNAVAACERMKQRFGVDIIPVEATDCDARAEVIRDAAIVFATGAAGVPLLEEHHWSGLESLKLLADANATPPLGIGGSDMMDRGKVRHGKTVWGAIGFGTLKLALHRACIAQLFTRNDLVLDAEAIYRMAREMP
jgi:hypothetical protein